MAVGFSKLTEPARCVQAGHTVAPAAPLQPAASRGKLHASSGHGTRNVSKRAVAILVIMVGACAAPVDTPQPPASAPADGRAAVVRRPLPEPPPKGPATAPALAPIEVPAGYLYVCVTDADGQRKQVGIEFAPKVQALCQRHPEMGPCQYERQSCRRSGGRVFAASGQEITPATEAEYDRKVLRARFRAN